MRVACVVVTHLRAKVEMGRHRHLRDCPVVVVDGGSSKGKALVVDHFPAAWGVREGMSLEEAVSHHADAVVLDADEPHYRQVFGRVLTALQEVTDRVEASDLGTAYARLDGLEGLYGGEAGAVAALLSAVPAELSPRVGVADAKFPAFVAARTRQDSGASPITGDPAAFLAPHPIDLLAVSTDLRGELHRIGLHTMGAVASMSQHLLADRFGPEGERAWSLCNGIDDSPVVPLVFEPPVVEHISLGFHSPSIEALLVAVDSLLRRAFARPDVRDRRVGMAHLGGAAPGWPTWERSVRFKEPLGSWEQAAVVVRSRLEADPPRRPVEDVTLTLSDFEPGDSGTQLGLLRDARGDRLRRLVETDRRLRSLMGGDHVLYRIASVAPWHPVPEMRFLQTPIDPSGQEAIRPLLAPRPVDVRADAAGEPRSFRADRRWTEVARIDDRWTFDLWWLAQAKKLGYRALALTDTNLCGALEFARQANNLGVRPITGGELTLIDGSKLTLLAATRTGYSNISRLFTTANAADRRDPRLDPSHLPSHSEGVVLLTGGRDGPLSRLAMQDRIGEAHGLLRQYLDWYGPSSVYIELQQNLLAGDTDRNRTLARIAAESDIGVVATNDVHYHTPDRSRLQHALVAARLNTTIDQALPHLRPNHHLYLKLSAEMEQLFAEYPKAVSNTLRIAEQCSFDLSTDLGYDLPDAAVPPGCTPQSYLEQVCREAAIRRYGGITSEVERRLAEEFSLIERLNLAGFLLLYREIALLAQQIMVERDGDAETGRSPLWRGVSEPVRQPEPNRVLGGGRLGAGGASVHQGRGGGIGQAHRG